MKRSFRKNKLLKELKLKNKMMGNQRRIKILMTSKIHKMIKTLFRVQGIRKSEIWRRKKKVKFKKDKPNKVKRKKTSMMMKMYTLWKMLQSIINQVLFHKHHLNHLKKMPMMLSCQDYSIHICRLKS